MASVDPKVNVLAAEIAADDPLMRSTANAVLTAAKAAAARRKDSGQFLQSIKLTRGGGRVRDWVIYSDDPDALPKEFGHTTETGRFVPGIHAFGQALGEGKRHA